MGSWLGLGLILASGLWLRSGWLDWGWPRLIPVAGAAALIACGEGAGALLSRRPLVLVGLFSYPLYLWHWPLIAFTHCAIGRPEWPGKVALVLVSMGLAYVTWQWVERPFRERRALPTGRGLGGFALACGLGLILVGGWLHGCHGRRGAGRQRAWRTWRTSRIARPRSRPRTMLARGGSRF